MNQNQTDRVAEEATGIRENTNGLGKIYIKGEIHIFYEDVPKVIRLGYGMEAPNAGAGSYKTFFIDVAKYDEVKFVQRGSGEGDQTFAVRDGKKWYLAFQYNRSPAAPGFAYTVSFSRYWWSFEEL
jgi:hypothetical protein